MSRRGVPARGRGDHDKREREAARHGLQPRGTSFERVADRDEGRRRGRRNRQEAEPERETAEAHWHRPQARPSRAPGAGAANPRIQVHGRIGRSFLSSLAASTPRSSRMPETTLTWLGHATFRLDTPAGKRIYVDPFLNGNPKCPESEQTPERVDVIALTHGHGDHVGDTVDAREEARLHRRRAGRARRLARQAGRRERPRPEQGRHRRGRRRQVHAHERASTRARTTTARVHGRAVRASSSRSRTGRSSTSPATRASSATCS